jgi:hypothetical protein
MSKVKLVSNRYPDGEYAGQEITLPFVGTVKFDDDGSVEVPEDKADAVIEATLDSFDFHIPGVERDLEEDDAKLVAIKQEIAEFEKELKETDLAGLIEAAKEVEGFDISKAGSMTDGKLRKVILDAFKKAKLPAPKPRKPNAATRRKERNR